MSDNSGVGPAADPFQALLADCGAAAASRSTIVPALASLTADLAARNHESVQLALAQTTSSRSALLARKTRVLGSTKRLSRKQCKGIVADLEAADVSTEQLRVWAAVVGTCADLDGLLECALAASPLLASPRRVQAPAIDFSSVATFTFSNELGSVATGDGLRVVSAAGPGLKWFEPHSRNEFSVVLAQADGSVPLWLTAGDAAVVVISAAGTPVAAGAGLSAAAVRSEWVRHGTVSVAYGGFTEDAPEAVLQVLVCGAPVADAAGDNDWCARVPRKPLVGHECAAVGVHVGTLAVVKGDMRGMAVSADEKWLVVGLYYEGMLSVYSLPGGELVRSFGGRGDGPLLFMRLRRLCFAANANLIVVDERNGRLQEVALEGVFVRSIGVGEFGDGKPSCVAVHNDVIAVGCSLGTGPRVVMFDFGTGAVTSRFGEVGTAPGRLSSTCTGIRFTPDGSHLIIAEWQAERLSLFTIAGGFVSYVGVGVLGGGSMDLVQSAAGEYVVADSRTSRVCVFSPDGSELVRSWRASGDGAAQPSPPCALAAAGWHLYVMEELAGRVHVYE